MLWDVPVMTPLMESEARRFIALVDEFYERHIKLVVSAEVPLYEVWGEGSIYYGICSRLRYSSLCISCRRDRQRWNSNFRRSP